MDTKIQFLSDMLSTEEQIKVLESVIQKGNYDRLPELASKGYCFNIYLFDLLHNSGEDEVLDKIWDTDFTFKGLSKTALNYLIMCKGETESAHFIAERIDRCKVWQNCYQQFTPSMYEEVEDWKALCKKGCYEILAKHGKFDLIINDFNGHCASVIQGSSGFISKAIKILRQNNMADRVLELGQYGWFMCTEWQAEGVKILMKAGKLNVIYEHCKKISSIIPEPIRRMCETEEGREFLRSKGEYSWLVQCGYPKILVEDKKWDYLARHRKYEFIDWTAWLAAAVDSKEVFEAAVRAEQWEFLTENKKRLMLIKNGQFKSFFSTFNGVFTKKPKLIEDAIID